MKMPWKALFIWTLGITNCIFYSQAPSRAIRKMVCRRGCFWFCIFVSPCGLSVPTAVKLPALGAICEYPQRDGNAKGSLPFSDAFPVMYCGRKKEWASSSFSPHRWMSLLPSQNAGERWTRGVFCSGRFAEQVPGTDHCRARFGWRKLLEMTSIPATFSLVWTFSFQG